MAIAHVWCTACRYTTRNVNSILGNKGPLCELRAELKDQAHMTLRGPMTFATLS